jgi:hypothetical protein
VNVSDPALAIRYYAENYEKLYSTYLSDPCVTDAIQNALKTHIRPPESMIVDLGCGVGRQLSVLAAALQIPLSNCLGIDRSSAMHGRHDCDHLGWTFIEDDFMSQRGRESIIDKIRNVAPRDLIFICLGNAIGHVTPEYYDELARFLFDVSKQVSSVKATHVFVEYRDGEQYRKLCDPRSSHSIGGERTNAYGSAEFLGQLGSDFYAFYVREEVTTKQYRVFLYSLGVNTLENKAACTVSGLLIKDAFYVDTTLLCGAFQQAGFTAFDVNNQSALETGRLVGYKA